MSIYLTGVTFKNAKVRPLDDAAVFASVVTDGIANGCELSIAGATLNLGAGNIIACGRNIKVPAAQAIAVTGASSGYARLVLTIDLSASEDQQIKLDMEYASLNVGQADTDSWYNIESVYASDDVSVGLRKDSTVVFAGNKNYDVHLCQSWKDIIEIGIGDSHIVGLKADGTVVAVGDEGYEENSRCAVSLWTDVVSIAAGSYHTVGLKADGTVLATGENDEGQCNVGTWKNVVAIAAGYNNTVGVLADGTLVATGNNEYGQCNVQGVRMFYSLESFKEDEKKAIEETEKKREEQIAVLNTEKNTLQTELANLKGLFTGKRRKEIEARLAQIESELNKL